MTGYPQTGGGNYDGHELTVTILPDPTNTVDPDYPTLWGGYMLQEYIRRGGSIYISALDPQDPTGPKVESEKTEVVIPKAKYTATLHFNVGGTATMTDGVTTVNTDNGKIENLNGDETITTVPTADTLTPPGYTLVGVVATTASGTVNATPDGVGAYLYDMDEEDVDIYVIFNALDDPKKDKGPHMVTVYKTGDDGLADNDATVEDLDVVIPSHQKGTIWTAAYENNIVRVDVTTHTGYYAVITAVRKDTGAAVTVVPYPTYGVFEMVDADVDVTVEYIKGTPPDRELKLTVVDGDNLADDTAQVTLPSGSTPMTGP